MVASLARIPNSRPNGIYAAHMGDTSNERQGRSGAFVPYADGVWDNRGSNLEIDNARQGSPATQTGLEEWCKYEKDHFCCNSVLHVRRVSFFCPEIFNILC